MVEQLQHVSIDGSLTRRGISYFQVKHLEVIWIGWTIQEHLVYVPAQWFVYFLEGSQVELPAMDAQN